MQSLSYFILATYLYYMCRLSTGFSQLVKGEANRFAFIYRLCLVMSTSCTKNGPLTKAVAVGKKLLLPLYPSSILTIVQRSNGFDRRKNNNRRFPRNDQWPKFFLRYFFYCVRLYLYIYNIAVTAQGCILKTIFDWPREYIHNKKQ